MLKKVVVICGEVVESWVGSVANIVNMYLKLRRFARANDGLLVVKWSWSLREWLVACTFGHEAPDSPMAGGAAYGANRSLEHALADAFVDVFWDAGVR